MLQCLVRNGDVYIKNRLLLLTPDYRCKCVSFVHTVAMPLIDSAVSTCDVFVAAVVVFIVSTQSRFGVWL